jgi:hypothetical protein
MKTRAGHIPTDFLEKGTRVMTPVVRKKTAAKTAALLLLAALIPAMLQAADGKTLYMDVHHLGAGKVTADAVAEAHKKDLAVEGAFGVDYQRYWVNEAEGNVYCLVKAPSAEAAAEVHRRAHGLVADEVVPVQPGTASPSPVATLRLFMDTHEAGPGGIRGEEVARAHQKDLAAEKQFGVHFLEYWFDEQSGRVHCLVEAPSPEAVKAAHAKAHGMLPVEIHEVVEGH